MRLSVQCCYALVDGEGRDVFKDPITDKGKVSKKGRLLLVKEDGVYKTITEAERKKDQEDELVTVFENGELVKEYTFEEVRRRAEIRKEKV